MDLGLYEFVDNLKSYVKEQVSRNTMFIGTITNLKPMNVDLGNGLVITEPQIMLGQMCKPHKVTIPHTHILDTHFTESSPSIGNIGAGITGSIYEKTEKAKAQSTKVDYEILKDDGDVETKQITKEELGRGKIETSISVSENATITDDSVKITDNEHKHIISKQITKDVHFPKSDYEDCVIIEIEPKLQIGDKVLVFAFNNYENFYIAERIEVKE